MTGLKSDVAGEGTAKQTAELQAVKAENAAFVKQIRSVESAAQILAKIDDATGARLS